MADKNDKEKFTKEEMHKKAIENARKVIEIVIKNKEKRTKHIIPSSLSILANKFLAFAFSGKVYTLYITSSKDNP